MTLSTNHFPMHRRHLLSLATLALLNPGHAAQVEAPSRPRGRLLIIGGAEDRVKDKDVLKRFVQLCGGPGAHIVLVLAASTEPEAVHEIYAKAFGELGVARLSALPLTEREHADRPEVLQLLTQADGIFMSGGDQSRLMHCLWETPAAEAMHRAFHVRGVCVGGTSAGAAVMSRQMIAQGSATLLPEKDTVSFDIGLGLLAKTIVDQHFSQRRRMARLLSALAQRSDFLGVGIDEDTALLIESGYAAEVVGQGAVTLLDARRVLSNFEVIDETDRIEMQGVLMHVLPAGNRYLLPSAGQPGSAMHPSMASALQQLLEPGPMRG